MLYTKFFIIKSGENVAPNSNIEIKENIPSTQSEINNDSNIKKSETQVLEGPEKQPLKGADEVLLQKEIAKEKIPLTEAEDFFDRKKKVPKLQDSPICKNFIATILSINGETFKHLKTSLNDLTFTDLDFLFNYKNGEVTFEKTLNKESIYLYKFLYFLWQINISNQSMFSSKNVWKYALEERDAICHQNHIHLLSLCALTSEDIKALEEFDIFENLAHNEKFIEICKISIQSSQSQKYEGLFLNTLRKGSELFYCKDFKKLISLDKLTFGHMKYINKASVVKSKPDNRVFYNLSPEVSFYCKFLILVYKYEKFLIKTQKSKQSIKNFNNLSILKFINDNPYGLMAPQNISKIQEIIGKLKFQPSELNLIKECNLLKYKADTNLFLNLDYIVKSIETKKQNRIKSQIINQKTKEVEILNEKFNTLLLNKLKFIPSYKDFSSIFHMTLDEVALLDEVIFKKEHIDIVSKIINKHTDKITFPVKLENLFLGKTLIYFKLLRYIAFVNYKMPGDGRGDLTLKDFLNKLKKYNNTNSVMNIFHEDYMKECDKFFTPYEIELLYEENIFNWQIDMEFLNKCRRYAIDAEKIKNKEADYFNTLNFYILNDKIKSYFGYYISLLNLDLSQWNLMLKNKRLSQDMVHASQLIDFKFPILSLRFFHDIEAFISADNNLSKTFSLINEDIIKFEAAKDVDTKIKEFNNKSVNSKFWNFNTLSIGKAIGILNDNLLESYKDLILFFEINNASTYWGEPKKFLGISLKEFKDFKFDLSKISTQNLYFFKFLNFSIKYLESQSMPITASIFNILKNFRKIVMNFKVIENFNNDFTDYDLYKIYYTLNPFMNKKDINEFILAVEESQKNNMNEIQNIKRAFYKLRIFNLVNLKEKIQENQRNCFEYIKYCDYFNFSIFDTLNYFKIVENSINENLSNKMDDLDYDVAAIKKDMNIVQKNISMLIILLDLLQYSQNKTDIILNIFERINVNDVEIFTSIKSKDNVCYLKPLTLEFLIASGFFNIKDCEILENKLNVFKKSNVELEDFNNDMNINDKMINQFKCIQDMLNAGPNELGIYKFNIEEWRDNQNHLINIRENQLKKDKLDWYMTSENEKPDLHKEYLKSLSNVNSSSNKDGLFQNHIKKIGVMFAAVATLLTNFKNGNSMEDKNNKIKEKSGENEEILNVKENKIYTKDGENGVKEGEGNINKEGEGNINKEGEGDINKNISKEDNKGETKEINVIKEEPVTPVVSEPTSAVST
jgi:hypothetical protein